MFDEFKKIRWIKSKVLFLTILSILVIFIFFAIIVAIEYMLSSSFLQILNGIKK